MRIEALIRHFLSTSIRYRRRPEGGAAEFVPPRWRAGSPKFKIAQNTANSKKECGEPSRRRDSPETDKCPFQPVRRAGRLDFLLWLSSHAAPMKITRNWRSCPRVHLLADPGDHCIDRFKTGSVSSTYVY